MDIIKVLEKHLIDRGLITEDLRPSRRLKNAVAEISHAFTRGRADLRKNYFNDQDYRDAYLAGFVLTNAAKVRRCLMHHIDLLPTEKPLNILDVGSGPGTAFLAASEFLREHRPRQEVRLLAVESNRAIQETARELVKDMLPTNHVVEWTGCDMTDLKGVLENRRFDLAIAANALSEIDDIGARLRVCRDILNRSTALVAIEPALRETARALMALRDELCKEGFPIEAPCTHQRGCPMLQANQRDWCHFYNEWQRPRLIEMLDRATGLDHRHLKMAYIVIYSKRGKETPHRRGASGIRLPAQRAGRKARGQSAPMRWRVVSAPLVSKGKIEIVLCGGDGELRRVRRLDRDAAPANSDFDRVKRGDLAVIAESGFYVMEQF